MNRIYGSLYSPENIDIGLLTESAPMPNNTNLNQLLTLTSELNRQLEQYYRTIPIQPPITVDPISTDKRRRLNLRYLLARQIIYRPFVLYTALQSVHQASPLPQASPSRSPTPQYSPYPIPRIILDKCHICIQSCEAYIWNSVDILDKRTPYMWTASQSCLESFVVLFLAHSSPHLRHFVPNLDVLAGAVAPQIRKWAIPGSSLEALLSILDMLLASRHQ